MKIYLNPKERFKNEPAFRKMEIELGFRPDPRQNQIKFEVDEVGWNEVFIDYLCFRFMTGDRSNLLNYENIAVALGQEETCHPHHALRKFVSKFVWKHSPCGYRPDDHQDFYQVLERNIGKAYFDYMWEHEDYEESPS
ncbi:MAG: hypothetical protein JAY64_05655 [Candidatus Thiodiazotropha weberae]|nr:hypothetical protein [Candidatus Thiodiazotropha lotti]MCG8011170.1 hypothetical protein [Candidatus Thiodiazotropha lotti]MCW4210632.1 hypothetical protein [Candidatus Thiodiazotropha lotti]MCW4216645.1 hypothetical protein [Candidatus Thiodiazotropha lotti]